MSYIDPETLGRIVRGIWIQWAKDQPDIAEHPHWLTEWEKISPRDRDVDRRIGQGIAAYVAARIRQDIKHLIVAEDANERSE